VRLALLFLLVGALALAGVASATTAVAKLNGTVGPGFTISLKSTSGKPVKQLKAGKYTFVIHDKASIHTFSLKGPGISKTLTSATFVGTKSVTLTLKKGTYTFYCAVHPTTMTGKLKVT
jgi:plastocyanin